VNLFLAALVLREFQKR